MAQKSQGIQHLLAAEKKSADMVADARKRKTKRLKQAKEEAITEIENFRNECEEKFKEKKGSELDQHGFEESVRNSTDQKLAEMTSQVGENKDIVISRMIELVNDISPEIHENFRS